MSIQYTADQLQRKFRGATGSPGFSRLAEVLRVEGKIQESIQTCQEGLRARPNSLSGHLVLGKALLDAGRVEEARERFEATLRLDPRCLSAMHFLARIMTQLQWSDAAAGYYRSILEVEPWDTEIQALLAGASTPFSGTAGAVGAAGSVGQSFAAGELTGYAAPVEDTFHKPEGFAGDVMEVNLNDMAADFLPGQEDTSLGLAEESLEDALSASQRPFSQPSRFDAPAPQEPVTEPRPLDLLKDEAGPMSSTEGDAPPISGQDVEDRLDSLFGVEDSPSDSMRDAAATWSPAPAEAPGPEIPPAPDFSTVDPASVATATGEMRATETGEMRIPVEPDYASAEPDADEDFRSQDFASATEMPKSPEAFEVAEIPGAEDFSAVDFETPLEQRAPAGTETSADRETEGRDDRVHGEDIERRLDELFHLTEEDDRPPTETSTLPVAPSPKMGEAVSLGEVVSFGGEVAFEEAALARSAEAEPEGYEAEGSATEISDAFDSRATAFVSDPQVTGQDVADKLDNLFGEESESPSEANPESAFLSPSATGTVAVFKEPKPWPMDDMESAQPPPTGDIMSTESMLPPGWFGEAGDGPRVTGEDVEAQLDKLFHIEEDGETLPSGAAGDALTAGNSNATFDSPGTDTLAARQADTTMPGDEADLTVTMAVMRETPSAPKDTGSIKESVAEWLARRTEDADQRSDADKGPDKDRFSGRGVQDFGAGETLMLPAEDVEGFQDFDATLELPAEARETSLGAFQDEDSFGTLAQDDAALLSETTSIEMVDGEDVAGRLDELFADDGPAGEMSLFTPESGPTVGVPGSDAIGAVSGEDVSSRLQQLFEDGDLPAAQQAFQPESGVASGSETDEDMVPLTGFVKPASQTAPGLAPMSDEEEGYPEDDDVASQSGAGANVATVTLAEIYFQQGLKEQALQIYRQLLEREPENDSVRKRIEEIEATKPEGGEPGPGSDPRRPRPGLKVPKRKK